jgi:aryl-alcohol dehydrogenase-like predicted oxidoreductase
MRYKKRRCANIDVSEMALGTWVVGGRNAYGEVDRSESIKAIRTMLDNGVNFIDTAPVYGNGYAEQLLAEALVGYDREKLTIVTKFGLVPNVNARPIASIRDNSFKNIIREVQSSLSNIATTYLDIYMIHYFDENTPLSETMAALNSLKERGFIRHIGVSNFTQEQIEEAQKYGKVDVLQMPYSMVNRDKEELLKWSYANGIDVMSYGSLGSGILSGAIRATPEFVGKRDIRATFYGELYKEPKFSNIMKLLEKMDVIAKAHNKPVAQVAINWSTQKEFMMTILVGVRNELEAAENCAAFDWKLTAEEMATLDKALIELNL